MPARPDKRRFSAGGGQRLGILLKTYPKISETFILREILELEAAGLSLHLFSLNRPTDAISHSENETVSAPVSYVSCPPGRTEAGALADHAGLFLSAPFRYLRTLTATLTSGEDEPLSVFGQAVRLARLALKSGIRHLHVHFANEPAAVALAMSGLTGIPYSLSAHAKDIYLSRPEALRKKIGSARFTVTCTEYNRRHLSDLMKDEGAVHRIYHGLKPEAYRPRGNAPDSKPRILSIGRLREKKGFPTLLAACALLLKQGVDFECTLVGYGPLEERLKSLANELGLEGRVRFAGKLSHDEVLELYREATVFALPCQIAADGDRDGIPNVLIEAMALGLPVVSTPVSGILELIDHDENGLLVPPEDAKQLSLALMRLLGDPRLRQELGACARSKVVNHFNASTNALRLRDLLVQADSPAKAEVQEPAYAG